MNEFWKLAYFQAGVRLAQCEALFSRSVLKVTKESFRPHRDGWLWEDETAVVYDTLSALGLALDLLVRISPDQDELYLKRPTIKLWGVFNKWCGNSVAIDVENAEPLGLLRKIQERVCSTAPEHIREAARVQLRIGHGICNGEWCERLDTADQQSSIVYENESGQYWRWREQTVLEGLLTNAGYRLADLCTPGEIPSGIPLSFDRQQDQIWYRVEAALRRAIKQHSLNNERDVEPQLNSTPDGSFVPTAMQKSIWDALAGRALSKAKLAAQLNVEPSRLYKPGGIKEMREAGLIDHKTGPGYFRPDALPENTIVSRKLTSKE